MAQTIRPSLQLTVRILPIPGCDRDRVGCKCCLVLKQVSDGFVNTLKVALPALLTVTHEVAVPRQVSLGDLERAFTQETVHRWNRIDLGLGAEEVGLRGSATQVWKIYKPPPRRKGTMVNGPAQRLVEQMIMKLESLGILDEEDGTEQGL